MVAVELVCADLDRKTFSVPLKIPQGKVDISGRPFHAVQNLDEAVGILSEDHAGNNRELMFLVRAYQLIVPAFEEWRLPVQAVLDSWV